MRIAIPVLGFGRAGGFRVLSQLANYWTKAGHSVKFLSPCQAEQPYFPTIAPIVWLDALGRQTTHGTRTCLPPGGARGVLGWMWLLSRALSRRPNEFDAVIANHSLTGWSVAAARTSARKIYYIQAYEPECIAQRPGLKNRVLRWLSLKSYEFRLEQIVNAAIYRDYQGFSPIGVVPPGIDLSLFSPRMEIPDWRNRTVVVGCIGRDEPTKGTHDVFDAFQLAVAKGFPGVLKVAAYGGLDHPVARSLHCETVIPKNDQELAAYYRSLDVLIAPGTVQLGAVHYPVLESMACGVPVINTGYSPSDQTNSWIVPIRSPQAIASTLFKMMEQPELRLARTEQAIQAVKPFAWETVSADFIRLIDSNTCSSQSSHSLSWSN